MDEEDALAGHVGGLVLGPLENGGGIVGIGMGDPEVLGGIEKNRLVVEPVEKSKITLKSLLAGVTQENIHPETDWGKPMGKEIW